MDAIRWQGDSLALLDQTRLPTEEVWDNYTDYRKVVDAIRRLVVRGAPAIGIAAAYAVCLAAMEFRDQTPRGLPGKHGSGHERSGRQPPHGSEPLLVSGPDAAHPLRRGLQR